MTAREVLDQIEQRASDGPVSDWDPRGGDEPHHRVIDRTIEFEKRLRVDAIALVAALRAVLDLHRSTGIPNGVRTCIVCRPRTPYGENPYAGYALWPCPTVRAITEALGGGA